MRLSLFDPARHLTEDFSGPVIAHEASWTAAALCRFFSPVPCLPRQSGLPRRNKMKTEAAAEPHTPTLHSFSEAGSAFFILHSDFYILSHPPFYHTFSDLSS